MDDYGLFTFLRKGGRVFEDIFRYMVFGETADLPHHNLYSDASVENDAFDKNKAEQLEMENHVSLTNWSDHRISGSQEPLLYKDAPIDEKHKEWVRQRLIYLWGDEIGQHIFDTGRFPK